MVGWLLPLLGVGTGIGISEFLGGTKKGAETHAPYEHYAPVKTYAPAQSYAITMPATQYMIDSAGVQTLKSEAKSQAEAEPHITSAREEGMPTEIPYLKIIAVAGVAYVASSYLGKKKR